MSDGAAIATSENGATVANRVDFAVIGDIMTECILRDALPGTTWVCDPGNLSLGGPGMNVAWHLTNLDRRAKIIGCIGDRDKALLQTFADVGVDLSGVFSLSGASDQLVAVITKGIHRSVYIRAPISDPTYELMVDACQGARCIVLNGSRHPRLRQGFAQIAAVTNAFVAFNPSYAVFTYDLHELEAPLAASALTILNESETAFVCDRLGAGSAEELSRRFGQCLVTTLGDRGAVIYRDGRTTRVPSVSGVKGDVLGAGDAFLAGLLMQMVEGRSAESASLFAAALASVVITSREIRPRVDTAMVRRYMEQRQTAMDPPL
jgi:sugar/nucleoside kinase (ribokinase family)